MQFHFVCCWLDASLAQNQLQFGDGHVGRADVAHQSHVDQFFHLAPGLHVVFVDVWLGVCAAQTNIAARWMEVWKGPMNEVEVEVVEAQIGERLAARSDHLILAVFVVPKLRSNPEVFALDAAAKDLLECGANLCFIAIDRGAIEVTIAGGSSALDSLDRKSVELGK